jgi:hypothetical protein
MFIPDPDFYPSRIPDPKTATKERGEKKFVVITLSSHKFHKIANYFSFEVLNKKIWANFQRIIDLFTQKIVNKLSKIWVWDPGSGKTYSGSRIQGSKRHPIADPQHWSPASAGSRIMKKFSQYTQHSTCYLVLVPFAGKIKGHTTGESESSHSKKNTLRMRKDRE